MPIKYDTQDMRGGCVIPRQARKLAQSGMYHVMLRGIDRQRMFEDVADRLFFLELLQEYRQQCGFKLYAYCLLDNHVHILLRVGDVPLEGIMKRIGCRYVYWFNVKYQRIGHLFQDRFKSEPVEDDAYFLTVLRHIHQNPVKAKLCAAPGDYTYSSYAHYLAEKSSLVDTEFALGMLPREEFILFNNAQNRDQCLEITERPRAMTDDQARKAIEKISHCSTIIQFQELDEKQRIRYTKNIHKKGVSIRQISRLTGTGKGTVERWLKGK